jgi:hypothetical protein
MVAPSAKCCPIEEGSRKNPNIKKEYKSSLPKRYTTRLCAILNGLSLTNSLGRLKQGWQSFDISCVDAMNRRWEAIEKAGIAYYCVNTTVTSKLMEKPYEIEVTDRESFIRFLELLHRNYLHNRAEWENSNLGSFLEAVTAYTQDIQGYYDNTNQNINANTPSWKIFADILKGAKIYE